MNSGPKVARGYNLWATHEVGVRLSEEELGSTISKLRPVLPRDKNEVGVRLSERELGSTISKLKPVPPRLRDPYTTYEPGTPLGDLETTIHAHEGRPVKGLRKVLARDVPTGDADIADVVKITRTTVTGRRKKRHYEAPF